MARATFLLIWKTRARLLSSNAQTLAVTRIAYPLAPGEEPTGLAYDQQAGRLFSACHNEKLVVTDSKTGRQVAVLPIGQGVDGAAFDPS